MITTLAFWKGAAERGVKTFLQSFVAIIVVQLGADTIGSTAGILDPDWGAAASVAALATVLSLATSIGNARFTAGEPQSTDTTPQQPPLWGGEDSEGGPR